MGIIKTSSILVFFSLGISISSLICGKSKSMAEASVDSPAPVPPSSAAVYIVYTEKPADDVELESLCLQTISSVLGSDEAAKSALIYVYKNAASGFSAKLTPDQVSELRKQPGVLQVVPDQALQLHSGVGTMNLRT